MTYDQLLLALRRHAMLVIAAARTEAHRQRLRRDNAECVLRNKARLLAERLQLTSDLKARRKMLVAAMPLIEH